MAAAPAIVIQFDPAQLKEVEDALSGIPNGLRKAQAGAINKIILKSRTSLVNIAAGIMNVPRYVIAGRGARDSNNRGRARITVGKASGQSIYPKGSITITTRGIEMMEYRPRQLKKGVRVKFWKDRSPMVFPHWFINKGTSSGKPHVLSRDKRAGGDLAAQQLMQMTGDEGSPSELVPRYPIKIRYGPSVATLFHERPQLFSQQFRVTQEELQRQLYSQVDRFLNRKKGAALPVD